MNKHLTLDLDIVVNNGIAPNTMDAKVPPLQTTCDLHICLS